MNNNKHNMQILTIILACILIMITGISGVISAFFIQSITEDARKEINLGFNNILSDDNVEISPPKAPYIGQLNIIGEIQGSVSDSYLGGAQYDHDTLMEFVDTMMDDEYNTGILLNIDSPGGTVYHSDELYLKLMEYKEKTERPIYAFFGSEACSGGYYVAMAADKIYANRNCWTGSIGVIISSYNYKGLFDKLGISEIDVTSGPNKAMGSGGLEMTEEQRAILQSMVDEAYDQFVKIVAEGRKMSEDQVRGIADGRIYTALQAADIGLVDKICNYDETTQIVFSETESEEIYSPEYSDNIYSLFSGIKSFIKHDSDSDIYAVMDMMKNDKNGVLMYYAK